MKLSCTKENLNKALAAVSRVVGSTTTLPVLANVLLATDGNRLKLTTTNLEIGINYWVGAKVNQPGGVTVPARLLADFIANIPDGTVDLEVDKNNLTVKTDNYRSVLNGIAADEFPSLPVVEKATSLKLPAQQLKAALAQVTLVASSDDTRPVLNGVYFYTEAGKLFLVATDSYRLAEKTVELGSPPPAPVQVIIPSRVLTELVRIDDGSQATIELLVGENQIMFRFEAVELVSRLIDGQFPDYRSLIPADVPSQVTISTQEFANLAKVAGLFAYANAGSVNVEIDQKAKSLRLTSLASQVGENTSEAKVRVQGDGAAVTLNCRYLSEALGVINEAEVAFGITGKVNPCVLRPVDNKDYIHIIMPLRA